MKRARDAEFIFANQSGMGLVQALVLVAVCAVLAAAMGSSMLNVIRSQATTAQAVEADLFVDQLRQVLSDNANCAAMVNVTPPNVTGVDYPVSFTAPMSSGTTTLQAGQTVADGSIRIDAITNKVLNPVNPANITSAGVPAKHYDSQLTIKFSKTHGNSFVGTLKPYQLKMHLIVETATGNGLGCSVASTASDGCEAQGGTWNPLAPDGAKCISLKYCQYGGSWAEASDADGGFANGVTGARTCDTAHGFIAQQSGVINKAISTSKYSVANQTSRIFACMKCGNDLDVVGQTATVPPTGTVPLQDANNQVYDAVAADDLNNYQLALSDKTVACRAWQDGVNQSAALQAAITSANTDLSTATTNYNTAQNAYNTAAAAYTTASTAYANAVATYNSNATPANAQAVADALDTKNARANDQAAAFTNQNYYQSLQAQATTNAANFATQKTAQDGLNPGLQALCQARTSCSDDWAVTSNCSTAANLAHTDPSSCQAPPPTPPCKPPNAPM